MKMKSIVFSVLLFVLFTATSQASVERAIARVYTGWVSPELRAVGVMVTEQGEVLYIGSVISTLAPQQLRKDCWYSITFARAAGSHLVSLLPPQVEDSCGNEFPVDR